MSQSSSSPATSPALETRDLGTNPYAEAHALQLELVDLVRATRETDTPIGGVLLLLEHDPPVITMSRRPGAAQHLLATGDMLARQGVELRETDRGGDITYHGPGQVVAYPILDLNVWRLNLHAYLRLLEQVAIDACARFGVIGTRDSDATGVWVESDGSTASKICAIGIRASRWISYHGLALNVNPNLEHFKLIVPCGLHGRRVTSLEREISRQGNSAEIPSVNDVKSVLAEAFAHRLQERVGASRD